MRINMEGKRPKTIKVCVYSSRNLKPKKGDGDPLAWVVFGFGKEKCCTKQLRDRNAKWNEDSTFTITDTKSPLKFNIKDKDDPLGQIVIPLNEIPDEEHFLKWVPLGPHKKNSNPHGEICIDCWVEDYYHGDEQASPQTSSKKPGKFLKKNFSKLTGSRSPDLDRKRNGHDDVRRHSYSPGVTSIKGSISMEELSRSGKSSLFGSKSKKEKDSLLAPPAYTNMRKSVSTLVLNGSLPRKESKKEPPVQPVIAQMPTSPTLPSPTPPVPGPRRSSNSANELSQGLPTIKEQCYPPKIQNIIPTSGPSTGGTLIQITGKFLGNSREDITRLMVAGCNCLDSVEYYAPNKIICTTSESIGIGPITLSTRSGGMSSSKMMFEFVEVNENGIHEKGASDSGRSSGASDGEKDLDKDEIIERLRNEVDDLKHDNQELREYIDKLVVYLMDKYPGALESSKMYR